jgi:hypothetical protein
MTTQRETRPLKKRDPLSENESGWHDSQLDRHRLVIACVRGNVSVRETLRTILQDALPSDGPPPLLVLGPTAPEEISNGHSNRIGWVTFVDGSSLAHPSSKVEIISPDNLLEVNLFIEKCVQESESKVIVGDFLDNVIRSINSPESFYSFFCQLASRVKLKKRTAILVIKEDIHDRAVVETVKRFADLVLEFRDQDTNGALKVEMRTLNFADNIYTSWRPFSDWLQPLSMTA